MGRRANPETNVTNEVRRRLEAYGFHFIKLSDQFTRGVPDGVVAFARVIMIEFKVDLNGQWTKCNEDGFSRTYKQLGLKGSQDHHIRAICQRTVDGACVMTGSPHEDLDQSAVVWAPIYPDREGPGYENYGPVCIGWEACRRWLAR